MAPNSKKRKAAEIEGDQESSKPVNGYASPSTDGRQSTPPLIGLDASEVPFKVTCPAKPIRKKGKAGRSDVFGPTEEDGGFPQLKTTYTVKPGQRWADLKPYRNFIVADNKFSLGSHVYISHPNSPKNPSDYKFIASAENSEPDFWVAKVLEVRASDQQHVYLRVFWLYWPDELPGGRRPYHGLNEVLMSNHMDIIDAMTVSGAADIRIWHEKDEDEDLPSLFFRQFYNVTAKDYLSELRRHCICREYYNPDSTLLKCNASDCGIWLHEQCLIDDVLAKTYKTFVTEGKQNIKAEDTTPTKAKAAALLEPPKTSLLEAATETLLHPLRTIRASMSPGPKPKDEPIEATVMESTTLTSVSESAVGLDPAPATSTTNGKSLAAKNSKPAPKAKGKGKKKGAIGDNVEDESNDGPSRKAIEACFAATIESSTEDKGPVKISIEDLRPGHGGEKWKSDLCCLRCGKQLD